MIKAIDMALKQWAQELHSDEVAAGYSGGNMVAMMMESGGQLVRGRRGSRAWKPPARTATNKRKRK